MRQTKSRLARKALFIGLLALCATPVTRPASAAGKFFGSGSPASTSELPSGDLRKSLESLPATTQTRAMTWLQSVEFSTQDLPFMKVDSQGSIYYADSFEENKSQKHKQTPVSVPPSVNAKNVFRLHSHPGATNIIFVDFDGAEISGKAWNKQARISSWKTSPYDTDGKPKSLSDSEISDIVNIWERVTEDFAPFDVDVTTEDPGKLGQNIVWLLVTDSEPGSKQPLPSPQADSVTYMNTFGFSGTAYYTPALVYYNNIGSAEYIAEATSHSIGHIMGLSHDTTPGSGSGKVSWAPIMGTNHLNQVTQWSKGEYPGAVNKQDDIGILVGALGLCRDDHDDSRFDAGTPLVIDSLGQITAIHPGLAPNHHKPENKGVIEDQDDIDVFVFDAGKGVVDINVLPAWHAYEQDAHRGANLDVKVTLFDANGKKIAESDPRDETSSRLRKQVAPGRYKLEVRGTGNSASAYSRYGSIGQYYLAGNVPPASGKSTTLAKTSR